MENSRRKFLKNIAYKAPVVVALGTLVIAPSANAKVSSNRRQRDNDARDDNRQSREDRLNDRP